MEPTHGTPPAAGIASFRSANTRDAIPLISGDVKQFFLVVLIVHTFLCVIFLFYSFLAFSHFLYIPVLSQDCAIWHTDYSDIRRFLDVFGEKTVNVLKVNLMSLYNLNFKTNLLTLI